MSRTSDPHQGTATDRRAARTRTALRDALIALVAERGWDDIAVQDICKRADVGRSTFYLHYSGKDALLESGFDDLRAQARAYARPARVSADASWAGFSFVTGLVLHVQENRKIFRRLVGRKGSYAVHQRFREMIVQLIEEELPPMAGALPAAARARCLAALLTELLGWWVDEGARDADPLSARFNRIAVALLTTR